MSGGCVREGGGDGGGATGAQSILSVMYLNWKRGPLDRPCYYAGHYCALAVIFGFFPNNYALS